MLYSVNYSHIITQSNQNLPFLALPLSTKDIKAYISISKDILPPKGQVKLFFSTYLQIILHPQHSKKLYMCVHRHLRNLLVTHLKNEKNFNRENNAFKQNHHSKNSYHGISVMQGLTISIQNILQ